MFKNKKLRLFLAVFLAAVVGSFIFLGFQYVVPIAMYHSVNPVIIPEINRLIVHPGDFERQMRFLKENRYNVVNLDTIASLIKEGKRIPPKTIAITFDDGYVDNYIYAFPVLKKYGIPATVFIIVNEVGRMQGDRLSWVQIKEMQDSGLVTIGSHCLWHEPLVNIKSDEQLRSQIFDSKRILEEKLGREVYVYSYPSGMFNEKIKGLVRKAGYKVAVATNPGRKFSNSDVFALKRLRISSNSGNLFIFWFETNGFYNFIREHRRK